jgi:hypothetical protein
VHNRNKDKENHLIGFARHLLFTFGHQLLHAYAWLLGQAMSIGSINYHMPADIEKFLYGSSMIITAFIALILSTPDTSIRKKAVIIALGVIAFFLTDLIFVQYVIFPQGQPALSEDSPVFEIYLCIKWLLPFVLWIYMSYQWLGKHLSALADTPQRHLTGGPLRRIKS